MLEPWALEFKARKKKIAWMLYQQRIIASADVVVATSEQECNNIKQMFPRLPVAIIPNGVNMPSVTEVLTNNRNVDRVRTVLFMSRIHPVKNLTGLLHAWSSLSREVVDGWRLQIAGPDEAGYAEEVMLQIRELCLHDTVELIGAIDEDHKEAVLQSADIFVLPSFTENFGLVVAEALAYGLPVIATTGTPWQDLPRRGCGWWVAPGSDTLTEALRQAMIMEPQVYMKWE